jgi:hypothetical protein
LQHGGDEPQGQADDVEVATLDAWNPFGGVALNAVGTCFVHWLARGDVGIDLLVSQRQKLDAGDLGSDLGACCGRDGDSSDHTMGTAGEHAEHSGSICGILRFGEDVSVKGDRGVSTEDNSRLGWSVRRNLRKNRLCFMAGKTDNVGDWVFVRIWILVDVRGTYFKGETSLFEEFAAARRGGSQDEWVHVGILSLTRFFGAEWHTPAPVYDQRQ